MMNIEQPLYKEVVKNGSALRRGRIRQPPQPPPNYDQLAIIPSAAFERGQKFDRHGCEYYKLQRDFIYTLNTSQQLKCYSSSSYGNLCIFSMPSADSNYLNSITYQLVRLAANPLRYGHVHYLYDSAGDYMSRAEFFKYDRETRIFNRSNEPIMKSDFINTFHGRVALRVKGLRVVDDYHIYLDATVFQVKIDREDDLMPARENNNSTEEEECIFA